MTRWFALVLLCQPALALASEPSPPSLLTPADIPVYRLDTESGLDHTYDGPWEYVVGGGVAVLDCNSDGRTDLFVAGGENPAQLFVNNSQAGALRFASAETGVEPRAMRRITGAYPLDFNGDGVLDLAVMRVPDTGSA